MNEFEKIKEDDEKRAFVVRALCSYIGTLASWEDVKKFINNVSPQALKTIVRNAGLDYQKKLEKVMVDIEDDV